MICSVGYIRILRASEPLTVLFFLFTDHPIPMKSLNMRRLETRGRRDLCLLTGLIPPSNAIQPFSVITISLQQETQRATKCRVVFTQERRAGITILVLEMALAVRKPLTPSGQVKADKSTASYWNIQKKRKKRLTRQSCLLSS